MPFLRICSNQNFFGHIKGAFTSAVTNKRGLFEEANGGTILLDEIGDLTMALQSKLLRVVEDQEIRPVGGVKSIKVDLRFVTATNKDIEQAVRDGKFREDLFYRINTITIKLPPLRERKEDIDLLIRYYLNKYSHELGRTIEVIDHEAMGILLKYCWPGNIRELQNIIERAILMSEDGQITKENLPERVCAQAMWLPDTIDEKLSIEDYAKTFILKYQGQCNEHQLAEMLGITRKALWEKRKRWGMTRNPDRES